VEDDAAAFLVKAERSLVGAQSEWDNGRYDNCANRSYYACFQAAVSALMTAGVQPRGANSEWGHDFVQARFVGDLIHRRKVYPSTLRDVLVRLYVLRQAADYTKELLPATQTLRALQRAHTFVETVQLRRRP
jgi:uncharacterized protein (UPF0332 family)